jgi:hypothetical protein
MSVILQPPPQEDYLGGSAFLTLSRFALHPLPYASGFFHAICFQGSPDLTPLRLRASKDLLKFERGSGGLLFGGFVGLPEMEQPGHIQLEID